MKSYDVNKPSNIIVYFNANNLYGCEMSQYLSYGGFGLLSQKEMDRLDVNSIGEKRAIG